MTSPWKRLEEDAGLRQNKMTRKEVCEKKTKA